MTDVQFIALCVVKMLNDMRSIPGVWAQTVVTPMGSVVVAKKTNSDFVVNITMKSIPLGETFTASMISKGTWKRQPSTTTLGAEEKQNVQDSKAAMEFDNFIREFFKGEENPFGDPF